MDGMSAELIIAVGAAAMFGALGYKHLIDTVIKFNRELLQLARERQQDDEERETLKTRISELERELAICKDFIQQKQT